MIVPRPFRIDTHAHVFPARPRMVPRPRYTPRQAAQLEDYLGLLDEAGLSHGVLVQPSFLGTDNTHLVDCLRRAPDRLKGIAVVSVRVTDQELSDLAAAGVVGVRINLLDAPAERYRSKAWQAVFARLAALGWIVQVQAQGTDLPAILDCLWPCGAPLVIDHFGRPDPRKGVEDEGFRALASRADQGLGRGQGRIWVKFSAPYRVGSGLLKDHASRLLDALGAHRILWGSDWPWTQHEEGKDYAESLDWLRLWVDDDADRDRILGDNPARLFGWSGSAQVLAG